MIKLVFQEDFIIPLSLLQPSVADGRPSPEEEKFGVNNRVIPADASGAAWSRPQTNDGIFSRGEARLWPPFAELSQKNQ